MNENLENEMNKIMGDAEAGVARDAVSDIGRLVAAFYKSLVENGVPRFVAVTLTSTFISGIINKNLG